MECPITDAQIAGRIVELRVHGVSGTKPESMLGDPAPVQVAGDDSGRIFRRGSLIVEPFKRRARVVEAFHWGQFTAGSPTRALWLLLLPFALLNLARFAMLVEHREDGRLLRTAETLLRLLGLALTLTQVVTACYIGWQVGMPRAWFGGNPGLRLLVGSVVPLTVIAVHWWLGRQTFIHDPPGRLTPWRTRNGSFDDVGFWRGSPSASLQRANHTLAALGVVGGLALLRPGWPMLPLRPDAWPFIQMILLTTNALVLSAGVVTIAWKVPSPTDTPAPANGMDTADVPPRILRRRRAAVAITVLSILFAAWASDSRSPAQPALAVEAKGAAVLSVAVAALLLAVVVANLFVTVRLGGALRHGLGEDSVSGETNRWYPHVPPAFRPFWGGHAAGLLAALAAALGLGFSTGAAYWAAGIADNVEDVSPVFGIWAFLWGVLVLAMAVTSLPLSASMLTPKRPVLAWVSALLWVGALTTAGYAWWRDAETQVIELWDLLAYLVPLALAAAAIVTLWRVPPMDALRQQVDLDYPASSTVSQDGVAGAEASKRAKQQIVRLWVTTGVRGRYHYAVGMIAGLGGTITILAGAAGGVELWRSHRTTTDLLVDLTPVEVAEISTPAFSSLVGALGVSVVTAMAAGLITLGVRAWRAPTLRSTVGIIWDLLSFWPRLVHPLCPPPYGGRAVLGLATRAVQLAEARERGGLGASAVVLSGHSQGSLVAVAAAAVLDFQAMPTEKTPSTKEEGFAQTWLARDRAQDVLPQIAVVGYGSQLQFIYARLFPTYFGFGRMEWLYNTALRCDADDRFGRRPLPRWRSLYRWTDPIGGPVLAWPAGSKRTPPNVLSEGWCWWGDHQGAAQPVRCRQMALGGPEHIWDQLGADIRLLDPAVVAETARTPRLPPLMHTDYPLDPVFDLVVADLGESCARHAASCRHRRRG